MEDLVVVYEGKVYVKALAVGCYNCVLFRKRECCELHKYCDGGGTGHFRPGKIITIDNPLPMEKSDV